jgi:fused signal recognition particle receptor
MFNKLKEKFTGWFKKKSEEPDKSEEKKTPLVKAPKVKPKKETKSNKPIEQQIKEKADKIKGEVPKKFNEGMQGYVPDTEKLKEKIKEKTKLILKEDLEQLLPSPKKLGQVGKTPKPVAQKPISPNKVPVALSEEITNSTPSEPKPITSELSTSKPQEKQGFFAKLKQKLSTSILTQNQFDEIFPDLEITLLENNVALEAVDKIKSSLEKDLVGISIKKSAIEQTILSSLKEAITATLIEPPDLLNQINKSLETFTIVFVGINGSGKTTSIAKLAHYLKQNKISCCLGAADTFRAASIEQLSQHAEKLKVPIIKHDYGSDPAAVAFDTKKYAKAHNIKVALIDTAGRMYTKTNLIKEMEKIIRISKPNLKLFVAESITGNDATEQAKTFNEAIDFNGIILSKADIDEKAGTILSVSQVTNKPIYFLGTGQDYSDLQVFSKDTVLKNLGLE